MTGEAATDKHALLCPEGFVQRSMKRGAVWVRRDVTDTQLEAIISHDAEVLKQTDTTVVRRLGHWVVKETRVSWGRGVTRHNPFRRAWMASHYLRARGVRTPEPLALVEEGRFGVVKRGIHIFQYLSQCSDVETYLSEVISASADGDMLADFLAHLAQAINRLNESGAWHADLSGKNIFTRDGTRFYIIDLDAVSLDTPVDEANRLKNHVQLYDSFCDALSDTLLVPFIQAMLPEHLDLRVWMPRVRAAQEKRRARVEAHWAKHGPPDHINPLRAFRSTHL